MNSLFKFLGPPVIATVVVIVAVRLRWEFASPEEKLGMMQGGANDLAIWALVLGIILYRALCLMRDNR